jgi:hypothetical protein
MSPRTKFTPPLSLLALCTSEAGTSSLSWLDTTATSLAAAPFLPLPLAAAAVGAVAAGVGVCGAARLSSTCCRKLSRLCMLSCG